MPHALAPTDGLFMLTRFPRPGNTKTRLIPALGPEGAAMLQRQMTEHLLARFQKFRQEQPLTLEVHYAGATAQQMKDWLGPEIGLRPQSEGNLGQRLHHTFRQGFAGGLKRVLVVGSDCPGIGALHVVGAFEQLQRVDVVIGPAEDGGYYLIGLTVPQPELFADIPWGQETVLARTLAIARRLCLKVALLSPLPDIDRPEDLPLWEVYASGSNSSPQRRL